MKRVTSGKIRDRGVNFKFLMHYSCNSSAYRSCATRRVEIRRAYNTACRPQNVYRQYAYRTCIDIVMRRKRSTRNANFD